MNHFLTVTLLMAAGWSQFSGLSSHAQTRPMSECSQKLTARGFTIIDKDLDDNLYEFEAIKNNQEWDIKMDQNCNVLLERIDD